MGAPERRCCTEYEKRGGRAKVEVGGGKGERERGSRGWEGMRKTGTAGFDSLTVYRCCAGIAEIGKAGRERKCRVDTSAEDKSSATSRLASSDIG